MSKTFVLLGKSFELPSTSVHFLETYMARMKSYGDKYIADTDCVSDIEERIMERLSECSTNPEGITEKDVLKIVNELGEPEDIFKDFEKKGGAPSWVTHNILTEKKWVRNKERGLLLGVCAGIADNLGVSPWIIRLVFIILTPPGGFALFLYIILAIFMTDRSPAAAEARQEKSDAKDEERPLRKSVRSVAQDI